MYILYGGQFTRALIVEMVMAEGDLAYELREVDIVGQEHRSAEFLAINPSGLVPVLVTPEGETLHETPAINIFLAEHHDLTHLVPRAGEADRGAFLSGMFFLAGDLEPLMKQYFYPQRYVTRADDAPAMKQKSFGAALERLAVIDQRLRNKGPYHLGERFSLVDLTMAYWTAYIDFAEFLHPYPAIRECMALVTERPKLRAMFTELRVMSERYAMLQSCGEGAG